MIKDRMKQATLTSFSPPNERSGWLRHLGCSSGGDGSDESAEESSSSSSVADRLAVILQVARKVQNQLGAVCDAAEKIKK